jgi:Concanavalin A-like lectin/glucanases superfamily
VSAFSNAVLALSPSSYWRFEGGSPLSDSGSSGITLTAVGSPVRAPSLVPGESGAADNAYDLDGTNMYFTAGNNYGFSGAFGTQKFTVAWWFKLESTLFGSDFQRALEKQDTADLNKGWSMIGANTPNDIFVVFDQGATEESTLVDANLVNGDTRFVVLTWDSSVPQFKGYLDGALVHNDTVGWSAAIPATTVNLAIGARNTGANKFNGVIDDVIIWDGTVLTDPQVEALWDAAQVTEQTPRALVRHSRGTSW